MQRRLAEELRALQLDNKTTLLSPGGVGYSTSIQRVAAVSVSATGASLVFPSRGSSSSSSPTSLSSSGSAVVSPSSEAADESYRLLRMEAFSRDLSEIASHMVGDGYTEGLIAEFSRASRRQSCSGGGDAILQTWFSELGVDWVVGVDDESSLHGETWSAVEDKIKQWAVAFTVMAEALRLTRPAALLLGSSDDGSGGGLSRDDKNSVVVSRSAPPGAAVQSSSMSVSAVTSPGSSYLDQESWSSSYLDQENSSSDLSQQISSSADAARPRSIDIVTVKEAIAAYSAETRRYLGFGHQEGPAGPQDQFVDFARASLLKMLRFPPVVAAQCRSPEKILCAIGMYSLISDTSPGLLALLSGGSKELVSGTVESVLQTMSAAVWEILQNLTKLIKAEDSWKTTTMQGNNGDIHPVNQYVVNYINLLLEKCTVLDSMLRRRRPVEVDDDDESTSDGAVFVMEELSKDDDAASLTTVIAELIRLLDAMLEEKSKVHAATAAGRGYIFLLNNAYFILQQAEPALRKFLGDYSVVYRKQQIDRCIGRYLDASWGPVTACLCLTTATGGKQRRRKVSSAALVDFNTSLQTTYHTEKFWKISSPQLRSRLRRSVSNEVVSAYRVYLETHALALVESSATYTPKDLEDLFEDLFEG